VSWIEKHTPTQKPFARNKAQARSKAFARNKAQARGERLRMFGCSKLDN